MMTERSEEVAQHLRQSMFRLVRTMRRHDDDELSPTTASILFSVGARGPADLGRHRTARAPRQAQRHRRRREARGRRSGRAPPRRHRRPCGVGRDHRRRQTAHRCPPRPPPGLAGHPHPRSLERRSRRARPRGRGDGSDRRGGGGRAGVIRSSREALRTTFRSLGVRNFRLFFTGQLISQVGNWLTSIALVAARAAPAPTAASPSDCSTAAQFGPILVLGAWAGLVADRIEQANAAAGRADPRDVPVVRPGRARVLAGTRRCWSFYAVAFVGGIALAFDNPTRRAFVVEMVPEDDVQNAVSLNAALMTSSRDRRPGAGRAARRDRRVRLVLHRRRGVLPRGAASPAADANRGAAHAGRGLAARARARCARGSATCGARPDLWIPLVMMAVDRHVHVQLRGGAAAVRSTHDPGRDRHDLHRCCTRW